MPHAIQIKTFGGPEVMEYVDLPVGDPPPGQVRIRHRACGVNFLDTYHRTGLYPNALPLVLGSEGAGVVVALGEGVTHLAVGERVAYAGGPPGAYSEERVLPAQLVVRLPDSIDFDTAAGMMLKGMTAQFLLKKTLPQGGLQPGDFVFPTTILMAGSAPTGARAGAAGALVMAADRHAAHELMVSVPPLLELLAG